MITCNWASSLTRYDCREVLSLHGERALEIGTPFAMVGGSAIVLYLVPEGDQQVLISDNGDTLVHLSGVGLDVTHGARLNKLRDVVAGFGLTLTAKGDFRALAQMEHASFTFARAVSGLLAVAQWARSQSNEKPPMHDLAAEAEPYILARSPGAPFERKKRVIGASNMGHVFDFLHGTDLIDVIVPQPRSTGLALRKAGDVQSSAAGMDLHPLIVVDDRQEPEAAEHEIGILGSLTRAMPFSRLMTPTH